MQHSNNPSLEIPFIMNEKAARPGNKFGELNNVDGIAFDPETTGSNILAESMAIRLVADKRDLEVLERIVATGDDRSEPTDDQKSQRRPEANAATATVGAMKETAISEAVETQLERIIGLPDFLPTWFFATGHLRSRAICKIETSGIDYEGANGFWVGTGFLISPNILLTNHHVLNSKAVAQKAVCIFNYEIDEQGKVQSADSYTLDPNRLFITSPVADGLDFTACWIEPAAAGKYGFIPVYRHSFAIKNGDCANIIQHPEGSYKSVVVQHNEIRDQSTIALMYDSDTQGGSSGSGVFNNAWRLVALHHASKRVSKADPEKGEKSVYRNEGIKMAAIAAYLEGLTESDRNYSAARELLRAFNGVDSAMGFFGSLGRGNNDMELSGDIERVVARYKGEDKDLDICFWNIEWFNKHFKQKLDDVAWEISVQNLDIWVLSESSAEAAKALVAHLKMKYQLAYGYAASEPTAPSSKQTTTVLWNTRTVSVEEAPWPAKVQEWFTLNSGNFSDLDELQKTLSDTDLEKVDGKIFDRYPARFKVKALAGSSGNSEGALNFYLVPLHLKAMSEGSKRRRFASRILAEAIDYCIKDQNDPESEWMLGGDLNATLASKDLEELSNGGLVAATASDAAAQAFSYLKKPHQSLIDHIFLSPNLVDRTDKDGFMILARERDNTRDGNPNRDYLTISDHRPIMIRLSLSGKSQPSEKKPSQDSDEVAKDLTERIKKRPVSKRDESQEQTIRTGYAQGTTSSLSDALKALEEGRNREYYNAMQDSKAKKAYYGLAPESLTSEQLFEHFHKLVESTHTKRLSYQPASYLYPWVDLHRDGQLVSIYNGEAVDPETFIESDFRMMESEFEADQQYNCEHVVPQSWFNKSNPQRGDLHHLFACEPICNSFRGNIPYIEYPDWEERVMENCGRRENTGFEPKLAKGVVARATLYFMLRYPTVKTKYNRDSIKTLIAWTFDEKPSEYELHRNAAIQELQGNRNPFIDYPKLATQLAWNI